MFTADFDEQSQMFETSTLIKNCKVTGDDPSCVGIISPNVFGQFYVVGYDYFGNMLRPAKDFWINVHTLEQSPFRVC